MRTRQWRLYSILGSVFAAVAMCGCVDDAQPVEEEVEEAVVESAATGCALVSAGSPWWNQPIAEQTGSFHVEFDATPSANGIDAVIGLSDGPATTWSKLAAIVRFNPSGFIDARDGSQYRPSTYRYQAGVRYHIRLDVSRYTSGSTSYWSYQVHVRKAGSYGYQHIAGGALRTEQQAITRMNNVASFVTGSQGSVQICGIDVYLKQSCTAATGGGGFSNAAIPSPTSVLHATITAKASQANMDGVFGLSSGPADAYNDFAASVRFGSNGTLQARDGDIYRADTALAYQANQEFKLKFIVDVPAKRYTVLAIRSTGDSMGETPIVVARDYAFRPQQVAVTRLDNLVSVVASASGRVDACGSNSAPAEMKLLREGVHTTLPLAADAVLISKGSTTTRIDAAGRPTATVPRSGQMAADSVGNIYIASAANGTLTVNAYTATLATRWTRTYAVASDATVASPVITSAGELGMVLWRGRTASTIERIGSDGTRRPTLQVGHLAAVNIQLDASGYAVVRRVSGGYAIEQYTMAGGLTWRRVVAGEWTAQMVRGPDRSVVLAGHFSTPIDFGTGVMQPSYNPEADTSTFIAALSNTGATQFTRRIYTAAVTGLAVTGNRIALATFDQTQFYWMELRVYDRAGTLLRFWGDGSFDAFGFGLEGLTGAVSIGSSGRVYLNITPGLFDRWSRWPFLIGIAP